MLTQKPERRTFTVQEVAHVLGIGRTSAYEAVRRGEIPVIRVGKRLLVPQVALDKLLLQGTDPGGLASRPSRRDEI